MILNTGDTAPRFTAEDIEGNPISLDVDSNKLVLLSFYRYASCPLCNMRIAELKSRRAEVEAAHIQPIGIFHSPPERMGKYVGTQSPWFPLVSDPELELYKHYGVQRSWTGVAKGLIIRAGTAMRALFKEGFRFGWFDNAMTVIPADFLISPQGEILRAFYGNDIGDHIDLDQVLDVAAENSANNDTEKD